MCWPSNNKFDPTDDFPSGLAMGSPPNTQVKVKIIIRNFCCVFGGDVRRTEGGVLHIDLLVFADFGSTSPTYHSLCFGYDVPKVGMLFCASYCKLNKCYCAENSQSAAFPCAAPCGQIDLDLGEVSERRRGLFSALNIRVKIYRSSFKRTLSLDLDICLFQFNFAVVIAIKWGRGYPGCTAPLHSMAAPCYNLAIS